MKLREIISRKDFHYKDVTKRVPELTSGAEKVYRGEMGADEYQDIVNRHKPVEPYKSIPTPADYDTMRAALHTNKKDKLLLPRADHRQTDMFNPLEIQDGTEVKLRLDIPAYSETGTWIPTIHGKDAEGKEKAIAHHSVAVINDVRMASPEKGTLNIARGHVAKSPIATMIGKWENGSVEKIKREAKLALSSSDWIQVGMDPERHSYFYNRATHEPVLGGSRAIQVGGLVLVRDPIYGKKSDYKY